MRVIATRIRICAHAGGLCFVVHIARIVARLTELLSLVRLLIVLVRCVVLLIARLSIGVVGGRSLAERIVLRVIISIPTLFITAGFIVRNILRAWRQHG